MCMVLASRNFVVVHLGRHVYTIISYLLFANSVKYIYYRNRTILVVTVVRMEFALQC